MQLPRCIPDLNRELSVVPYTKVNYGSMVVVVLEYRETITSWLGFDYKRNIRQNPIVRHEGPKKPGLVRRILHPVLSGMEQ